METNPDGQLVRGHTYSGIFTQDNARVHLGDVHNYGTASTHSHNYYYCSSSSQQSPRSLTICGHGPSSRESELLSLKRRRSPDENEYKYKPNKEESLEHVLNKLGKFSKSIQDQRIGKDAKKIARRIALVIDVVKHRTSITAGFEEPKDDHLAGHNEDDFENVDKCLIVAKRVNVNTSLRRARHSKLTRVVHKRDRVTSGQWGISLRTSIFEFRNGDGAEVVETFSSLYLDPGLPDAGLPITVCFGETTINSTVSFLSPVICAYRVMPNGSKVFASVLNDDLEGLVALLADGSATLRDCDEDGGTLLHVSVRSRITKCV